VKVILGQVKGHDWWMHSHEDFRPKEEGDQVAFNGINQKGKRRQGTCLLLLLLYVFFAFLSISLHPCVPIIMCHLAMLYFLLITYKRRQTRISMLV